MNINHKHCENKSVDNQPFIVLPLLCLRINLNSISLEPSPKFSVMRIQRPFRGKKNSCLKPSPLNCDIKCHSTGQI